MWTWVSRRFLITGADEARPGVDSPGPDFPRAQSSSSNCHKMPRVLGQSRNSQKFPEIGGKKKSARRGYIRIIEEK